ncbi:MAG: TIGR00645 family protein [Pseudomonadota bacterium]|nr:hypothetical protein [Pseudomonadales bacterium]MDY6922253.1 TIGR00645 family protein [Pseudomonadota bacterium]
MESILEKTLYASRWLMAPVYLGMSLLLLVLAFKFFQEMLYMVPILFEMSEQTLILKILTLVDLTLVGSLVVMVMFSGYENFVSKIDISENSEKLSWLGKMDSGSLKLKVSSSIVAISAIHLLKNYMEFKPDAEGVNETKLMWLLIVHIGFVLSALCMQLIDKIDRSSKAAQH